MLRTEYENSRAALLAEAQTAVSEGNTKAFESIKAKVEALDKQFKDEAVEAANNKALEGSVEGVNFENKSVNLEGGVVMATLETANTLNEGVSYENAFANKLMGNTLTAAEQAVFDDYNAKLRNDVITTAGDNAFLVPKTVTSTIYEQMSELSSIFGDCVPTYVSGDLIVALGNGEDASDGSLLDETTAATADDMGESSITVHGYEIVKAVKVSYKLKKMAPEAFLAYITKHIAEKCVRAAANQIINGTGNNAPKGIVPYLADYTGQVVTCTSDNAFQYSTLTAAMAKLGSGYTKGSVLYARNDVIWNYIANITDEVGRPLFIASTADGGVGKIFGLTVKPEAYAPANGIVIGDVARGYALNLGEAVTIETQNNALARTTDYVGTMIMGGHPVDPKAFVLINGVNIVPSV